MLSWIPLVGPILQGLFSTASSIYSKFKDTQVDLRKQEVAEAQISQQIIATTNDDIALRILRDAYCFPAVVHCLLVGWDTMIADPKHTLIAKSWMWHVADFPPSYGWYLPSVAVFLLGNIGMNMWNRFKR